MRSRLRDLLSVALVIISVWSIVLMFGAKAVNWLGGYLFGGYLY